MISSLLVISLFVSGAVAEPQIENFESVNTEIITPDGLIRGRERYFDNQGGIAKLVEYIKGPLGVEVLTAKRKEDLEPQQQPLGRQAILSDGASSRSDSTGFQLNNPSYINQQRQGIFPNANFQQTTQNENGGLLNYLLLQRQQPMFGGQQNFLNNQMNPLMQGFSGNQMIQNQVGLQNQGMLGNLPLRTPGLQNNLHNVILAHPGLSNTQMGFQSPSMFQGQVNNGFGQGIMNYQGNQGGFQNPQLLALLQQQNQMNPQLIALLNNQGSGFQNLGGYNSPQHNFMQGLQQYPYQGGLQNFQQNSQMGLQNGMNLGLYGKQLNSQYSNNLALSRLSHSYQAEPKAAALPLIDESKTGGSATTAPYSNRQAKDRHVSNEGETV